MNTREKNSSKGYSIAITVFILWIVIKIFGTLFEGVVNFVSTENHTNEFRLLSSSENKDLDDILISFAKKNNIKLKIDYAGTLDIMEKLNLGEKYDAIWASNSIWLYMLNNNVSISNAKSTSINPIVFGIKKSKAIELGFVDKEIYTKDILKEIKNDNLKFLMTSATQTNTGASAYLGFIETLSGNPQVLTLDHLKDEKLKTDIVDLLSGVERSSGSEEFLEDLIMNGDYDAVVSYESSIINLNLKLEKNNSEPLYLIYPIDGVTISDSPLAYINNKDDTKKEKFLLLQNYILSEEGQEKLATKARRTWYGGTTNKANPNLFNKDWGIDTSKNISSINYPSTEVIKEALVLYQTEFKKPTYTVFCLDYSGSMYGDGITDLKKAMDFILDSEKSSSNLLQFSYKDEVVTILFSDKIKTINKENGVDTKKLLSQINSTQTSGGTGIYPTLVGALEYINSQTYNSSTDYNISIVLMTDGEGNRGTFSDLKDYYKKLEKDIPVYSIMFGDANETQLEQIAKLTNGKVFDGRTNLLQAFKEVRGYN